MPDDLDDIDTMPDDLGCSCGIETGDEDHPDSCTLWRNDAWLDGMLTWYEGHLEDPEDIWGWGTQEPTEVELVKSDDVKWECTCEDPDDITIGLFHKHKASCDLQNYPLWVRGDVEWNHLQRKFVAMTEPVSSSGTTKSPSQYGLWDNTGGWGMGGGAIETCHHDGTAPLVFPDGTAVYPSASKSSWGKKTDEDQGVPDYALYLEKNRVPRSAAIYIPWRDYGLPEIPFHTAAHIIVDTYGYAKNGMTVEVGCIGAHGRTGTVLACMAVIAGLDVDEAIAYVRKHHCTKAVESIDQEWWVAWFYAWFFGTEAPPTPPKKTTSGTTTKPTKLNNDLKVGDPCPACNTSLSIATLEHYQGLICNRSACTNYRGLRKCTKCSCYLDAHDLEGYLCWNSKCHLYDHKAEKPKPQAQLASPPAAPTTTPTSFKKHRFRKGERKK